MAYDGVFIKAQINEIKSQILGEHISRINENSNHDIELIFRKNNKNLVFTLSANPNFPHLLLSVTEQEKFVNPPAFCMLLRKYLQGGTIKNIRQIGGKVKSQFNSDYYLERVADIEIENIIETGDKCIYHLFIELMGKYSNIIVTNDKHLILDVLIKKNEENARLKAKEIYNINGIANKLEILDTTFDEFVKALKEEKTRTLINGEQFNICNSITSKFAGLSKALITHIINISTEESKTLNKKINEETNESEYYNVIYDNIIKTICSLTNINITTSNVNKTTSENDKSFFNTKISPTINYKGEKPSDFYLFKLSQYEGEIKIFKTINECINTYITEKYVEIKESTEKKNVEDIIKSLFSKLTKKIDIYNSDLAKSENYEKYKNWAELVSAFGYNNKGSIDGMLICEDYNNNNAITKIPYDDEKSVSANVEHYYDKYNKLKRTRENALKLIDETNKKLEHLNSIKESLELSSDKEDIYLIKEELLRYFDETNKINSITKQKTSKKNQNKPNSKSKLNYNLHHYKSSAGIDIYVGKNNLQNEYLTFTMADANDTWFHIKNATGSHVIVKKPYESLDDKTLVEAASLAAYFSEKKNETKATVDYTLRKELKKVKGKAPGFCIYHKNFSINVKPEILLQEIPE